MFNYSKVVWNRPILSSLSSEALTTLSTMSVSELKTLCAFGHEVLLFQIFTIIFSYLSCVLYDKSFMIILPACKYRLDVLFALCMSQ